MQAGNFLMNIKQLFKYAFRKRPPNGRLCDMCQRAEAEFPYEGLNGVSFMCGRCEEWLAPHKPQNVTSTPKYRCN